MANDDENGGKPKANQRDGTAAPGVPPGGHHLAHAIREMALSEVERLILEGKNRHEILARMSELNATESMRTLSDWMAEVRTRMAERDLEWRDFRRNVRRAQLEARYQMVIADIAEARQLAPSAARAMALSMLHRAAAQAEQLMIRLDGLEGPIKVETTTSIDIKAMSPDQRRLRIEELLAKRAAAKAAGQLAPGSN